MKKSTMELLMVIVMLLTLLIINIATLLLEGSQKGRPSRLNGKVKGNRMVITRVLQEVGK